MDLAWLMRPDARRGVSTDAAIPQWFQLWWFTQGRLEYPDSALLPNEALCLPPCLRRCPINPATWVWYNRLLLPRAAVLLWQQRTDLQQAFDLHSPPGSAAPTPPADPASAVKPERPTHPTAHQTSPPRRPTAIAEQPQVDTKTIAAHAELKRAVAQFNALDETLVLTPANWLAGP